MSQLLKIDLQSGVDINASLQVGDKVYYCGISAPSSTGISYAETTGDPIYIGTVEFISDRPVNKYIHVETDQLSGVLPTGSSTYGEFLMFQKDSSVNVSSLSGYYASVKLVNNSEDSAELFMLSSEISISSK